MPMLLEWPEHLRWKMRRKLWKAGSREIGGVLMGEQIERGHFRIVDFSVDENSGGISHFERRPEHHREALEAFFSRTGDDFSRYNYLGEWHSHPRFAAQPSATDIGEMLTLVEDEPDIDFSVLLIVRTFWRFKLAYSAMLFQRGGFVEEVKFV